MHNDRCPDDYWTHHCQRCHREPGPDAIRKTDRWDQTRVWCPPCWEEQNREWREQKEQIREARESKWRTLCPVEFRTVEEGGSTDLEKLRRRQPKSNAILDWKSDHGRGLLLIGPTGSGKTRLAWRVAYSWVMEGRSVKVATAAQFDLQCRDAGGSFKQTDFVESYATADLLFLDDLGQGRWSDNTESAAFEVIDYRTAHHRPLLITTNSTGEDLENALTGNRGPALVRRLRDYCEVHVLK